MLRATKCVTQPYESGVLDSLLGECLTMTYNAIHYGEKNGIDDRKGMKGFYQTLKDVKLPSCYKVASITRACAVLKSRGKSERRGIQTRHPKPLRPMACIISGYFISMKGRLFVPLARDRYADFQLNHHVQERIAGKKARSLTITPDSLSFCYSEEVEPMPVRTVYGVDRNEKNLTFGNAEEVVQLDMSKMVSVRQTTRDVLGSFKRNDVRMRRKLAHKYWKKTSHRIDQMLHATTNFMVETAVKNGAAFALEDLTDIRKMYRKGNGQGTEQRFRLNSWSYWKAAQMLEYKSAWKGVTVIPLTKAETYGSSSECASCGERLHNPEREDAEHKRMLWCQSCKTWTDRDVNAALNLSERGRQGSPVPSPSQQVARNKCICWPGGKGWQLKR